MDLRCQYASTHCPNMRSLKISGELHRFCLFHRRSANAAQRRWKQKKLAAATGSPTATSGSEDDAIAKPTKPTTRRRGRDTETLKQETTPSTATKRRRTSREIAAPRCYQAIQQAPALQSMGLPMLPMTPPVETLPPLFTRDDVNLLSQIILGGDENVFLPYSQSEMWWTDASYQQDAGVIV